MTHQAVDNGGIEAPGQQPHAAPPADRATGRQFVGRAQELQDLLSDLDGAGLNTLAGRRAPHARVLLIAGRPGSGRTALAEEFIQQVADRYPDGVLRARLTEPDGSPTPTAHTARDLLGALELSAPPGADADDLTGELRAALATRRVLLLLDGAADAEQVDPLLPGTPDSLVLAVSAGPLTGIPDVRPCTLGGLDTASALRLLSRYTGTVRITCDPRAAEQLVVECGRLPAALVLAGGWLAARPKGAVVDLVRRLAAEPGHGESRLSRVLSLVHADLTPATARFLRLLSLAPAGLVDPQTASALAGCAVPDAHRTLDELTTLGLLRPFDSPLPQYTMPDCLLPLLRRQSATQDRPAELRLAQARMLERTVRLLQSCRATLRPEDGPTGPAARERGGDPPSLRFPSRSAAARWLAIRQNALLAAARVAVADGEFDTLARRLTAALVRVLVAHPGTEAAAAELYAVHDLMLTVAERRNLHREQAAALLNLADLDARTGRTRLALARYRSALDAGRHGKDPYATGRAMESIGGAYQELGDRQRAVDWFGRALALRLAREEHADAARLHGRIAGAQAHDGRHAEAMRGWRAAMAAHRAAGDVHGQARALSELARAQEYAGHHEESLRTRREAVEWAGQAGDSRLQAALHLRLADTHALLGEPEAARRHRRAAERILGGEPAAGVTEGVAQEGAQGGPGGAQGAVTGGIDGTGRTGRGRRADDAHDAGEAGDEAETEAGAPGAHGSPGGQGGAGGSRTAPGNATEPGGAGVPARAAAPVTAACGVAGLREPLAPLAAAPSRDQASHPDQAPSAPSRPRPATDGH